MTAERSLAVLICTHNRVNLLLRTLHYLNQSERPVGWNVEILIVVNACSDQTLSELQRYKQESEGSGLAMTWIEQPTAGKSRALNIAIPHIRTELVAFVDDDHRVANDFLANVCAASDKYPEAGLFCGRILPDWNGSEPPWVHDQGPYRIYPLPVPRFDQGNRPRTLTPDVATPGGGNLFLRGKWLSRVGPFSTELGPIGHDLGGFEDQDWVLRAQNLGARLQYVPSVVQYHYVDSDRLTLGYILKKAYIRSASTVGLKNPPRGNHIPRYLYRKLGEYLLRTITALHADRRRFYLVRSAAALGEMQGHRRLKWTPKTGQ